MSGIRANKGAFVDFHNLFELESRRRQAVSAEMMNLKVYQMENGYRGRE